MKHLLTCIALLALSLPAWAYKATMTQSNPSGIYGKGEKIVFNIKIDAEEGDDTSNALFEYSFCKKYGMGGGWQKGNFGENYQLETSLEEAGGAFVEVRLIDATTRRPILDKRRLPIFFQIGALVAPEELRTSSPEPMDFDAFWQAEIAKMRQEPMKLLESKEVSDVRGVRCTDIKVSFPFGNPVSGYVAMPEGAKPKSLPLWISYHGAGVYAARKYLNCGQVIRADFNAHGLPNDLPPAEYAKLNAGEYKNYLVRDMGDRDKYFLKNIFLRALRALDYMKTIPEWDGRTIIISGHSQGGAQSLFVTGNDPAVTLVAAEAPGWCDMLGPVVKRRGGGASWGLIWSKMDPAHIATAPYYDMVHFVKRIKNAQVYLTAGFGDSVCPATSIYCAYNAVPANLKRDIQLSPLGNHSSLSTSNSRSQAAIQQAIKDAPKKVEPVTYLPGAEYRPVEILRQSVKEGTALDLSRWNHYPAGKFGRVITTQDGKLEFANRPGEAIRFSGCNNMLSRDEYLSRSGDFEKYKEIIRRDVAAARRAGYNLYRINALTDAFDAKSFTDICQVSEDGFKRLDFLLAELKKNGIYLHIALLGPTYFEPLAMRKKTGDARNMHKLLFYAGREYERNQFRFAASLLNHVNSYTGVAWKDEPAIAFIEFYNELYAGIALAPHLRKDYPQDFEEFRKVYDQFLGRRSTDADLDKMNPKYVEFCEKLVRESLDWCEKQVRANGYKGITLQNNYRSLFYASASWPKMKMLDNHSYFQHPRKGYMAPGSQVPSESCVEMGANYLRDLMGGRFPNRPFGVGEFYHVFWNPYQYEMGPIMGGYGALQDFSTLVIHAEVIVYDNPWKWGAYNFNVGHNPVARAGEFISTHLFRRRFVDSAKNWVITSYPKELLQNRDYLANAPAAEQSFAGLLCKYGIAFPEKAPVELPKNAVIMAPRQGSSIIGNDWFSEVVDKERDDRFFVDLETKLRQRGVLTPDNQTRLAQGIFESDTRQIRMNIPQKSIRIATPCAEVLAAPAQVADSFGTLQQLKRSVDSCVALLSSDDKPLAESQKMVLVYATRVVNSGMVLTPDNVTLINRGKPPVLVRTGKLQCLLKGKAGFSCYALDLSGKRIAQIPLQTRGKDAWLDVDTAKIAPEPPLFFELCTTQEK